MNASKLPRDRDREIHILSEVGSSKHSGPRAIGPMRSNGLAPRPRPLPPRGHAGGGAVSLCLLAAHLPKRGAVWRKLRRAANFAATEARPAPAHGRRNGAGAGETSAPGPMDFQRTLRPFRARKTFHRRERPAGDVSDHRGASARAQRMAGAVRAAHRGRKRSLAGPRRRRLQQSRGMAKSHQRQRTGLRIRRLRPSSR